MEWGWPTAVDEATPNAGNAGSRSAPPHSPADPQETRRPRRAVAMSLSDRALLEQGRRAFDGGDDATALHRLGRLVDAGLRFADVHYMLGILHERRDELEEAAASLREAIRINPGYVEALVALASVCERRGDFARAQGYAERAHQLCQSREGGLDSTTRGKLSNQQAALADALAQAGLRREAIEQYRQALDRCPTFLDIRYRLGSTLREAGLPFQALQEFERILDVQPGLVECRIQLGLTLYAMGRTDDAAHEWQSALEIDPICRVAHMYLRLVGASTDHAPATSESASKSSPTAHVSPTSSTSGWSTVPLAPATGEADVDHARLFDGVLPE